MKINTSLRKLIIAALMLATSLLLPFLTGQIQQIGSMLTPMHFPILICGFICGAPYGLAVGIVAPLLRSLLFGMPPLYPVAIAMAAELAVYGLLTGIIYNKSKKNITAIYISLVSAMVVGRLAWGAVMAVLMGTAGNSFGFSAFMAGAVGGSVPGIIAQLILIPVIVVALKKSGIGNDK